MPYKHNDLLKLDPYFDDFDDTKKFLRILFKPGYSVQARELTQLQTILQDQTSKLGSHIFENGSQIFGGAINITNSKYLRVTGTPSSEDPVLSSYEYFKGRVVQKNGSTSVRARIIEILKPTNQDPFTILILQYLTGEEFTSGDVLTVNADEIETTAGDATSYILSGFTVALRSEIDFYQNPSSSFTDNLVGISGSSMSVTVDEGIFYIDGFFVKSDKQNVALYALSANDGNEILNNVQYTFNRSGVRVFTAPTNRIGFDVTRLAVSADEDSSLNDPANGSYNFNAPGADRYVIDLNLISIPFKNLETDTSYLVTENFIELARVVEGNLDFIKRLPSYSEIIEVLARRTYDESGNYTVKPFGIETYNHLRKDRYILDLFLSQEYQTNTAALNPYYPLPGDIVQYKEELLGAGTVIKQGKIISIEKIKNVNETTELLDDVIYRTTIELVEGTKEPFEINDFVTLYASLDDAVNGPENDYYNETVYQVQKVVLDRDARGTYTNLENAVPEGSDDKMVLSVQPGKAYVFGYEFETNNSTRITIDKPRELASQNGFNLPANVGNYFIIKADEDQKQYYFPFWGRNTGAENTLSMQELDMIYFGGNYKRITIPFQEDISTKLPIKYWSPLLASERSEEWDSILFVSCPTQFTIVPEIKYDASCFNLVKTAENDTDDTDTDKFSRPQDTDIEIAKSIGQDNLSKTFYKMEDMSPQTESNISRFVFNEPFHGDFDIAYVPKLPQNITDTELSDDFYLNDDKFNVYQFINFSATNSPENVRIKKGKAVRWVPSSPLGVKRDSSLFVKIDDNENSNVWGDSDGKHNFNVDAGVVFQNKVSALTGSFVSYGSSVKRISAIENVVKITMTTYNEECVDSGINCNTGTYSPREVVTQTYDIRSGAGTTNDEYRWSQVTAVGEVVAVVPPPAGSSFQANRKLVIYVAMSGVYDFQEKEQNTDTESDSVIRNIDGIIGSCGCYDIEKIEVINGSDCGRLLLVEFREKGKYGDYVQGADVYQYNVSSIEALLEDPGYDLSLEQSTALSYGKVIRWDASSSVLWLLELRGRFKIENGIIYQVENVQEQIEAVRYGGRGWNRTRNNFVPSNEDFIPGADSNGESGYIEKVEGVFINIKEKYKPGKDFNEFRPTSATLANIPDSVKAKQVFSLSDDNYKPGKDFIVGEEVRQKYTLFNVSTSGQEIQYAIGKIRAFKHRDPTNPVDNSPTIILIEQISESPIFQVGFNRSPIESVNTGVSYKMNIRGTTIEDEFIGEARFKQFGRQTPDQYRLFFMDSAMYNVLDTEEKYLITETKSIHCKETEKFKGIFNREVAKIHPDHIKVDGLNSKTIIYDTESNSLIFPIPLGEVVKSVYDMDYRVQKELYPNEFSSTKKLIFTIAGSNYQFVGGKLNGKVEATDLYEHYILIEEPSTISDRARIIDLINQNYLVKTNNTDPASSQSSAELTIEVVGDDESFLFDLEKNYRLYATIDVDPTNTISDYRRKTIERYFNDQTKNAFYETQIQLDDNGDLIGTIPIADILEIDKVVYLNGDIEVDLTDIFVLDNGQTDNLYDFGKIIVSKDKQKDNEYLAKNTVRVYFRYYKHSGSGPFIVNSYSSLNATPLYRSPASGVIVRLDSFVDFRPVKKLKVGATSLDQYEFEFFGLPKATESFNMDYDYYLARNYKLILTRNKTFKVIKSPSALVPEMPTDDENSMTLFEIQCPAYVFDCKECNVTPVQHQRYTMKDISIIEQRLNDLQETVRLSNLEREAFETYVEERFKAAVVVDDFSKHDVGEVSNEEYNISIDFEENILRPPVKTTSVDLEPILNDTESDNVSVSDNMVYLNYTTVPYEQKQPYATTEIRVNNGDLVQWEGNMKLSPSSDAWFDDMKNPDIVTNLQGFNDTYYEDPTTGVFYKREVGPFAKRFNFWNTNWKGIRRRGLLASKIQARMQGRLNKVLTDTVKNKIAQYNQPIPPGYKVVVVSDSAQQNINLPFRRIGTFNSNLLGRRLFGSLKTMLIPIRDEPLDAILDKSLLPYMRSRDITVKITGLKPNTRVYPFFDDIGVEDHCRQVGSSIPGVLRSNGFGELEFTFTIPAEKFKVGDKLFVITDSATNDRNVATTVAEEIYVSSGMMIKPSNLVLSTRLPKKAPNSISFTEINPMAQTFFVDEEVYPNGIFLDSVMLFFSTKDDALPVTIELRPVIGGYPSSGRNRVVHPGSTVSLKPTSVNTTTIPSVVNGNGGTTFKFDYPVHLLPGEHALIIKTNTPNYKLYLARPSQTVIESGSILSNNAYKGSFFLPQNSSTWTPNPDLDMMFVMNRCVFEQQGSVIFKESRKNKARVEYDLINLTASNINFDKDISYSIKLTKKEAEVFDASYTEITPDVNIPMSETKLAKNTGNSVRLKVDMKSDGIVSPMFDGDRINMIVVKNLIDSNDNIDKASENYNGELNPRANPPEQVDDRITNLRARYLSKIITLENGIDANNVNVTMDINRPVGTNVQVFIKYQSAGKDKPFVQEPYHVLTPDLQDFTTYDESIYETVTFRLPEDTREPFVKFAIKICMYSKNSAIVPTVKNLKGIAIV